MRRFRTGAAQTDHWSGFQRRHTQTYRLSTKMTTESTRTKPSETRGRKILLLLGFLTLAVGIVAGRVNSPEGYQLSLYQSTPTLFWVGVLFAGVIGAVVGFSSQNQRRVQQASYLLSGVAVFSVVSLPSLRGFYFYGPGDAMSHLGWTRMIDAGTLHPFSLRYPGIHSVSAMVAEATAIDHNQTLLLTVSVFFGLFILFIPLCVSAITDRGPVVLVGVFSGLLILPINNVASHPIAFPTTQTIMFVPVVIYLLFGYLRDRGSRYPLWSVSGIGLLLGLSTAVVILLHPQQALTLLGSFILISMLQYGYATYRSGDHWSATHRVLHDQTALFALLYLLWVPRLERVRVAIVDVGTGLLFGGGTGGAVEGRTVSLEVLGGSLTEMFIKLFGISLVYIILAGILTLALVIGSLRRIDTDGQAFLQYLIAAVIPGSVFFVLFLFAGAGDQYFRYLAFIMMIMTIMGAVTISIGLDRLGSLDAKPVLSSVVAVVFVVFLIMQLLSFHPSPYIYQANQQISETQMSGYETAFDDREPEVAFAGIRSGPRRFVHAYYGTESPEAEAFPGDRQVIPEEEFNEDLAGAYDEQTYVPVATSDYDREVGLYEGLRYSEEGFNQLEHSAEIDRVQSNGEFRLYVIEGDQDGDEA